MEIVKMSLDKNHTKYIDGYIKKTKNKKLYKEYINFGESKESILINVKDTKLLDLCKKVNFL